MTGASTLSHAQALQDFFDMGNRALLAPMAGVTEKTYRSMAKDHGASLTYTEMVSATGLSYGSQATWELIEPSENEDRLAVQLFGHDPQVMAEQARAVQRRLGSRLFLIDVNMACPVAKVTRKGEGSALLKDPGLAADIIRAMSQAVDVPVTAKIRTGQTNDHPVCVEFAQALEAAGAAAIAVHGRSVGQAYRGESNTDLIGQVARAVDVPVIGSGDVFSPAAAKRLIDLGCSAVFVARGSYGDPWIFTRINAYLSDRTELPLPTTQERLDAARVHLARAAACGVHMGRMRKVVAWYLKGTPEAAYWRGEIMKCGSVEDFHVVLDRIERETHHELHVGS